MSDDALSNLLHEERRFPPSEEFASTANVKADAYDEAAKDRLAFWETAGAAAGLGHAVGPGAGLVEPAVREVVRRRARSTRRTTAWTGTSTPDAATRSPSYWEGEPGDTRTITYAELLAEVCRAANALTELGVGKGDRVAIYLPMIPETVVAMLACARLGAPHTVVFGGFSAEALRGRILDCDATLVITADGGYRRGVPQALKPAVDEAVGRLPRRRARAGGQAHRPGGGLDRRPRRVVARRRRPARATSTKRSRTTPSTRSTSCTPPARRPSPRASCTPPAATSPGAPGPTTRCSTSSRRPTCGGAPPTSAGSPATRTSSTGRWPTAPPRSCTRAPRTPRTRTGGGR